MLLVRICQICTAGTVDRLRALKDVASSGTEAVSGIRMDESV